MDSLIDTHQEDVAKGIPIGNLTSQLFANIYLSPLDHFIKEQLRQRRYIRYMDDFVIIGEEKGIDFLGYVVFSGGYKRLRRRNVVNFRRRLKHLAKGFSEGTLRYNHARSSIASWLGLVKHANAFKLSRTILLEHDVHNIGKRLIIRINK